MKKSFISIAELRATRKEHFLLELLTRRRAPEPSIQPLPRWICEMGLSASKPKKKAVPRAPMTPEEAEAERIRRAEQVRCAEQRRESRAISIRGAPSR